MTTYRFAKQVLILASIASSLAASPGAQAGQKACSTAFTPDVANGQKKRRPDLNAALLRAVDADNLAAAKSLLIAGANPNAKDQQGRTALMLATGKGAAAMVRLLLTHRAEPFLKDKDGRTALTVAVEKHNSALVKTLVSSVRPSEMLDDPASLPVMALAAFMQDLATVRELLRQGANPRSQECATALAMAATWGWDDGVAVLLKSGVDVNRPNPSSGTTILMMAAATSRPGQGKIVTALLDAGANIAARDAEGKTALMYAAEGASLEAMRVLLAHGADAAAKDRKGETAASIASATGADASTAMVALLQRSVSHTQDVGQRLELVAAEERGDAAALENLLSQGGDVNARDDAGETLLMKAAGQGRLGLVNLLLRHHADVGARKLDSWGFPALTIAAEAGHPDVVEALLNAGADPNVKSGGYTPLARAIMGHSKSGGAATLVVEGLLRHGADPNGKDDLGETELIQAATYGATDIARVLLDHGSKIDARGSDGNTALCWAVNNGWPDTVQLLVDRGADVNQPGADAERPMKIARERGAHLNAKGTADYRRIISTLKQAGAHE